MWPTRRGASCFSIKAACTLSPNLFLANSANPREKVASLGRSIFRSHPHNRRKLISLPSRSINCYVNVKSPETRKALYFFAFLFL